MPHGLLKSILSRKKLEKQEFVESKLKQDAQAYINFETQHIRHDKLIF